MKKMIFVCLLFTCIHSMGQTDSEKAIRKVLAEQTVAWNQGNVEAFMQGYWKSDSLLFIGKSGVNRGWQTTLNNYKTGYPNAEAMGKLAFDILEIKPLSADHFFVVGKWHLTRSIGDVGGHFSLIFTRINGQWKIIADHSS